MPTWNIRMLNCILLFRSTKHLTFWEQASSWCKRPDQRKPTVLTHLVLRLNCRDIIIYYCAARCAVGEGFVLPRYVFIMRLLCLISSAVCENIKILEAPRTTSHLTILCYCYTEGLKILFRVKNRINLICRNRTAIWPNTFKILCRNE